MMEKQTEFIRTILKKVRQIEVKTSRLVNDAMMGDYHSVFKGQGMDFEEVREYISGDEVRSIDWKVTARMNKTYVKKFREERGLTIILMVDVSASHMYGSVERSKYELAIEMAAVLAFAATRNNDKVGLLLFGDRVEKFIPAKKGKMHVLRLIRELLYFKPSKSGTNIGEAFRFLSRMQKRKAVVFLLSDFLDRGFLDQEGDNLLGKSLSIFSQRHDLSCIVLGDRCEMVLPSVGVVMLEDLETGSLLEVDSNDSELRIEFEEESKRRVEGMRKLFRKAKVHFFEVKTEDHYVVALRKFLIMRSKYL